jgi:hypothetical protein
MKQSIKLTRKQLEILVKTYNHFSEINEFTLEQDNSSGIGPVIKLKFDLFESNKTIIDITDVSTW